MSTEERRPEFAFIDWVARQAISRPEVRLGIGDDAAILAVDGREWVSTVDVLTEGVHFLRETSPELIGRKALAVNLSDLAAMAAEPCAAFVGIVLPKSFQREQAEGLYRGIFELAQEWNVAIAGGDTNSWDGPLVISITLMGLVEPGKAVRRDGAQVGDWIFVSGALGGSLASQRHQTFTPRVNEARRLAQSFDIHSMLDLSDGLGSDLFHLLNRSGVGACLDGAAIPIHADVPHDLPDEQRLQRALGDGEDFELLWTMSSEEGGRLVALQNPRGDEQSGSAPDDSSIGTPNELSHDRSQSPLNFPVTKIGEITSRPGARMIWDDTEQPLDRSGWSHNFGT